MPSDCPVSHTIGPLLPDVMIVGARVVAVGGTVVATVVVVDEVDGAVTGSFSVVEVEEAAFVVSVEEPGLDPPWNTMIAVMATAAAQMIATMAMIAFPERLRMTRRSPASLDRFQRVAVAYPGFPSRAGSGPPDRTPSARRLIDPDRMVVFPNGRSRPSWAAQARRPLQTASTGIGTSPRYNHSALTWYRDRLVWSPT